MNADSIRRKKTLRRWRIAVWLLLVLCLVLLGGHLFDRFLHKRFATVQPSILYRMGQPTQNGLAHIIRDHRIKTVLLVRSDDAQLRGGVFDWGARSGPRESQVIAQAGARLYHMPFGNATYWPWPAPDQLEDLLDFLSDPANRPVLVHCVGGQHRTGTVVALFRLEVDRWSVEDTLWEMYSFDFGYPCPLQEINLRTYWPRPRPDAHAWSAIREFFQPCIGAADYDALVRRLSSAPDSSPELASLVDYVLRDRPFAVPLAQRVLQARSRMPALAAPVEEALRIAACERAAAIVKATAPLADTHSPRASDESLAASAAILADFGTLEEQHLLLTAIQAIQSNSAHAMSTAADREIYYTLVLGVSNRYAFNRLAFLRPLLADTRGLPRPNYVLRDPESNALFQYRYCDLATSRLISTCNLQLPYGFTQVEWDNARQAAICWLDQHPEALALHRFDRLPVHQVAARDDAELPPLRR